MRAHGSWRLSVVAASAALATACGGGGADNADQTPGGGAEPTAGTQIEVTEDEFSISLERKNLKPGSYTFVVVNKGAAGHDLVIDGPSVDGQKTPIIRPGEQETLTVQLREGTYQLWCSVGNHREQGMDLTLAVGGAPATPTNGDGDY